MILAVLSPAKNLDYTSPLPKLRTSQPELLNESETLIESLKNLAPQDVCELMRLSDKLGQLNYQRFQTWSRPFTASNARPAVLAFNGDVYQGLDANSFSKQDFTFAQQHLRILSGLYGVLRPLDLMQPYRLEMGTKYANDRGKDLYAFWGDLVTQALNAQARKIKATALINLASNEYFRSVKTGDLVVPVIEPVFKDWKNQQYKVISFFAKKARGLMSAYIIKNKLTEADQIQAFDSAGYQFNQSMSCDKQWVFLRKQAPE